MHARYTAEVMSAPSICFVSSPTQGFSFSYTFIPLSTYEAAWGPHNPRHIQRAIGMLRELATFESTFRESAMHCTADELRVLDQLEACVTDPRAFWKPHRRRPHIPGRCRPPNAEEEAQETWISTWWERERAAREGRTIAYKKFYSQSARGQMLVTYIGGLVAEGSNAGPHDYVDAANIFFDYARTDVFAAEHGGLDAFEYGTLDAVRRAVLWWCRERKLAEIRSTLAAGTTHKSHPRRGQLRINHNSIIVLQQQKQALAKVM